MIVPEARGKHLYDRMWLALFDHADAHKIGVVVGIIDSSNARLCDFHASRGWTTYRREVPIYDLVGNFIAIGVADARRRLRQLLGRQV